MKAKVETTPSEISISLPNGEAYRIGWWQIEKDGIVFWHNHLRDKRWYTEEVSREFTQLCLEHLEKVVI